MRPINIFWLAMASIAAFAGRFVSSMKPFDSEGT
jgi:hypothetical protein